MKQRKPKQRRAASITTRVKKSRAAPEPVELHDPVTEWAQDVVDGRVVQGPWVRAACQRHLDDLQHGYKRGLHWELKAALLKIRFFEDELRLNGGQFEGLPFLLHPSQKFRIGCLFGWKRSDGTRRFRRFYDEEGKGNGKSPLLAGIGFLGMVADLESRAEIYAAGAKKDQAQVLFRDAVAMVEQSPGLSSRLKKSGVTPVWNLTDSLTHSFFKPIASDDSQSGPRPHFALCDEIHEHKDRVVVDMLERGFKFRRQPMLCMATNAGFDLNTLCGEEHIHAINVARGFDDNGQKVVDDSTFAFVCALDEGDDPLEDESCWPKANPLLDVTITREYLRSVVAQAAAIPGKRNGILRLHFCQWTDSETAWIEKEAWEKSEDPTLKIEDYAGKECWDGLDIGAVRDLTAKATVFRDGFIDEEVITGQKVKKPKFVLFVHCYMPKEGLEEKAKKDKIPYDVWVRQGFVTATPGKAIKLAYPARDCVADAHTYDLQAVAYDVWLIKRFKDELDLLGASDLPVVEHPQGFNKRKDTELWMPESINNIETLIIERRLRVQVCPPLRAAVMAAQFEESPAGLRRFSKQKARGRIDALIAATMALAAAAKSPVKSKVPQMFFVGGT